MAKRIITEADVSKMAAPSEIVIDRETVVTPSALDAAHLKNIRILYRRTEHRGPKPEIPCLPDGDYLLQVRKGETRIFEIRDDGVRPHGG